MRKKHIFRDKKKHDSKNNQNNNYKNKNISDIEREKTHTHTNFFAWNNIDKDNYEVIRNIL